MNDELDQLNPQQAELPAEPVATPGPGDAGNDREGAMAKADLYKLASYSHKLFKQMNDDDQLEGWIQAKITKAADYIASVYHYLEYEMKFSEYGHALDNSDVLSESQRRAIRTRLDEAKAKMKELKKAQADKMSEGVLSGGEAPCDHCGGTGVVHKPAAQVPGHVKSKVAAYNRQAKAMHAASKRLDKNNNGIPDEYEGLEEGFPTVAGARAESEKSKGTGKFDKKEIKPGVTQYTRKSSTFSDGGEDSDVKKAKKKAKEVAEGFPTVADARKEKEQSQGTGKFDKKEIKPGVTQYTRKSSTFSDGGDDSDVKKAKKKAKTEAYNPNSVDAENRRNLEAGHEKRLKDKAAKGDAGASKQLNRLEQKKTQRKADYDAAMERESIQYESKSKKAKKDYDKDGKIESEKDEVIGSRRRAAGLDESNKKAAKMWKDIKEGVKSKKVEEDNAVTDPKEREALMKSSDPQAYNKLKGIKPAGKPTTAVSDPEGVKESADITRMREITGRLNVHEKTQVNENQEVNILRKLSNYLKG